MSASWSQQQRLTPTFTDGNLRGTHREVQKFHLRYERSGNLQPSVRSFLATDCHWNSVIREYSHGSKPQDAILLFHDLFVEGKMDPNYLTFPSIFKACHRLSAIEEGRQFHGQAVKRGFVADVFTQRALIRMYARLGECDDASAMFRRCHKVDIIAQNDMINGYLRSGEVELGRQVFEAMEERNVVSWTLMVDGYVKLGELEPARKLFDEMPERNSFSWNSMMSGYLKSGQVTEARKLFDEMAERDVVSWTVMISGYTQNSLFKEALEMFLAMQEVGVEPNEVTLVSVLPAVANLGSLAQGRRTHAYIDRKGIRVDGKLGSALVDMYCKCGCIEDALEVFEKLQTKKLSAWNSIISGLAAHGMAKEALRMFSIMKEEFGLSPNDITFASILCACSHGGLVEEGRRVFSEMSSVYRVTPNIKHYGCMIDLLGRAGLLEEANQLIERMPSEPNLVIWKTLLAACRIHKDYVLAEKVAECVRQLGGADSGFYSLVTNVFGEAGLWENVGDLRQEMNDLKVKKTAGCTWIELGGVIHEFRMGGEGCHPRGKEIHRMTNKMETLIQLDAIEVSTYVDLEMWG